MPKVKSVRSSGSTSRGRKPITPEARENQMIALAMDLVERRLREGTASSQETTHFLKLGSSKAVYELERLQEENKLLRAKTDAIKAAEEDKVAYQEVIRALRDYGGKGDPEDYEYDDY